MKTHTNNNELYLGIDLGTTNSLGAAFDGSGTVKTLPNMDGDLITQSIVSVASKPPVVGRIAKQDKFFHPEMVAELFKRYMDMDQPALFTSQDGQEYTPVLLSAELLHYLKVSAEKLEGRTFSKAVIGAPAYFGKRARQATKDAGLIAGFEEVHIVDEPTLAATFYGLAKGKKAKIAVFDFGGGTFDISILNISDDGRTEPVAIDGNSECGGSNSETNNTGRIEFNISMDVEGLVDLSVRDKLLNKPVPIKFKFHTGLSDIEIEKARSQLLARHENDQTQIDKG